MQPIGTPRWLDLTTDVARARAFYGAVLGWTFTDLAGGWQLAHADGAPVAAIGPGEPRAWQVFLATDAVETVAEAAVAAGGRVLLPPGDVGEMGKAARIEDPGGAWVGLWQPGTHEGFSTTGAPGSPVWFEVNTRAGARVRDFFAGLFELTAEQMEGMEYFTLHAEGRPRFGVLQMNEQWEGMDPSWMAYFAVGDTDVAAAAVTAHGGQVAHGPFDTPFGRIAVCIDPMGTAFSAIRPAA